MREVCVIIGMIFLLGCSASETFVKETTTMKPKGKFVSDIEYVFIGMSKREVQNILGDKLVVGYLRDKGEDLNYKSITLDSPYREEELRGTRGEIYKIWYCYAYIKNADGRISEDEMIPLVFEEEKLIGKGWNFLLRLKKNL